MDLALWIITGLLAMTFLAGGVGQLALTKTQFRALGPSQHWVDDFSPGHIKVIGTIKIIGVLGLTVPALLHLFTGLVPLAACGLMPFMAGAGTTRFRRSEWKYLAGDLIFLGLFAFVAWGRFSVSPLS